MIKCPKCGTEYDGAERFCPKDGTRLGTGEGKLPKLPSLPPDNDPLIGSVIQGRYRVIDQIGEGGMGVVYVAEHVEIEKKVALKVLRDDFSKRPEVVARFRQEARSAGKIGNAHIVDVTDFGQLDNGGVYFVMEHLQGRGLNDAIRAGTLDAERGTHIVLQIAKALKAAHKKGIVHRDLKPENIFLIENDEEKDFVKILDFGIAKISDRDSEGQRLTKTGMIFGTPEYMSPEQASGKPLDHRVDIYALGCIMFEMFTGQVPFEGETFMAVLTQHMFEPPPAMEEINPDIRIPEGVQAVVYKAMAKEKEERYGDMMELAEDLERALLETGATLRENSAMRRLADFRLSRGIGDGGVPSGIGYQTQAPEVIVGKESGGNRKGIIFAVLMTVVVGMGAAAYMLVGFNPDSSANDNGPEVAAPVSETSGDSSEAAGTETEMGTGSGSESAVGAAAGTETDAAGGESGKEDGAASMETETETHGEQTVAVSISSQPAGAVVTIDGMGQVCSETPCELSLAVGVPISVEVSLEGKVAEKVFTPSEQNREVRIKIPKKQRRGARRTPRKPPHGKNGNGQPQNGELKIPSFFKDN